MRKKIGLMIGVGVVICVLLLLVAGIAIRTWYHTFEDVVIEPTCLESGYTIKTCTICGKTMRVDETAPLGHESGDWIIDCEKNCEQDGLSHTECIRCNIRLQEEVSPAGHSYHLAELLTDEAGCPARYICEVCEDSYIDRATSTDVGLPILNITGDLSTVSKTNTVTVQVIYTDGALEYSSMATIKLQGATSTQYPKKNYTIKFCNDDGSKRKIVLDEEWGSHSKYCLKANWVDATQAKNIVTARVWGQLRHLNDAREPMDLLVNAGCIDGFPIVVYVNDVFYGLYTMNIPKDEWLFETEDQEVQAVIFQNSWSDSGKLLYPISEWNRDGWKLEYCATEDTAWVKESFNAFIQFLNACDSRERFLENIEQYSSLEWCMDTMIYTYFVKGVDITSKNLLWVTYDGTRWMPQIYDLDTTWGLMWDGSAMTAADEYPMQGENVLYQLLLDYCSEELCIRYRELRTGVLNYDFIINQFASYDSAISDIVRRAEGERWPDAPRPEGNDLDGLRAWLELRIQYFDRLYGET